VFEVFFAVNTLCELPTYILTYLLTYYATMRVCVDCACSNDELTKRFEELDKDGNGVLSENEVVSVIGEMIVMCSSRCSCRCCCCCSSNAVVDRRDDGRGSTASAGADADV